MHIHTNTPSHLKALAPQIGLVEKPRQTHGRRQKHRTFDVLSVGGMLIRQLTHAHAKAPDIHTEEREGGEKEEV